MSVITTIYNALAENPVLNNSLARHKLTKTKPAIYEQWAAEGTEKPYICLNFFFGDSFHWGRSEAAINIDIFTDGDTIRAEAIRNQVIRILDKRTLPDAEESEIRCFLTNDSIIPEDNPQICHWNIEIQAIFWRNSFIDYQNELGEQ